MTPQRKFSAAESTVVIDLKGLHEVPFDTESSGTKSFRAIVFPKDRVSHVDSMVGHYVVHGEYRLETSLTIVYLHDGTLLLPNLLLSFIDHGLADSEQCGISVESLPLPLLKSGKKYQTHSVIRPIEDVAGFSDLPDGVPWSVSLVPTLNGLTVKMGYSIQTLGITDRSKLEKFIHTPLAGRMDKLFKLAQDAVESEVAAQATQDQRAAQAVRVRFNAKLSAMRAKYEAMELKNYDKPLDERILMHSDEPPHLLLSPQRKALKDGSAVCVRTTLNAQTVTKAVPVARVAQEVPILATVQEEVEEMHNALDDIDEQDDSSDEHLLTDDDEPLPAVRVRKPTVQPTVPSPIKKKAKPSYAMKAAGKANHLLKYPPGSGPKAASSSSSNNSSRIGQINPRTGTCWSREPYATKYTAPASALKGAAQDTAPDVGMMALVNELKVENAQLKERVLSLELQAQAKDILMVKSIQSARLKERQAVSHELRASYQEGLNDAVRLMSKKEIKRTAKKVDGKQTVPDTDHESSLSEMSD